MFQTILFLAQRRLVYVPICHTNYKAFFHSIANFSKTKNRGDVHETHPPGLMNKSDENNQRTFFPLQKNHTKELMHSFPQQQRLQLIHEYDILSSRRCRKSGGNYVLVHIIYQEMLNANSTNLPALFSSPPVGQQYLLFLLF